MSKTPSLDDFIALQESCLKIEREEEIRSSSNLEEGRIKELEKRGSALTKLIVHGSRTGLYGRVILTLVSRKNPPILPSHSMSSGDIVKIISQGDNGQESPSGVITSASNTSISISLDDDSGFNVDKEVDSQVNLVKVANDVTYKRLKGALSQLGQSDNRSRLVSILFGLGEMSPPNSCHSPKLLNSDGEIEYFNRNLNPSQRSAVEFALLQREIGIIHGPPGTGKTTTIVEVISQAVKSGSRVLCTAPSNVAVDNLLERLVKNKLKCVRLGHPARIHEELQKYSLDALIDSSEQTQIVRDVRKDIDSALKNPRRNKGELKELRRECRERENKAMKEIFSQAQVILSTLTSCDPKNGPLKVIKAADYFFDLVVIDECSQALELSCWIALPQAPKAILSGDHCQLPPTVMAQEAISKGFAHTLMERLVHSHPNAVRILEMQYRMNRLINDWSSKEFYESKLKPGTEEVGGRTLKDLAWVSKEVEDASCPLVLIDTAGCDCPETQEGDGSKANEGEAALVVAHVSRLVDSAGLKPSDIAVITPYNYQVELIRSQFKKDGPEVRTVDGFQGQEKEAVILSLVRSNKKKVVGFLAEPRRLNVAVTRAKRHLAVICDTETLSQGDAFLKRFVEYVSEWGDVRSAAEYDTEDIQKKPQERPLPTKKPPPSKKPNERKKPKANKKTASINDDPLSKAPSKTTPVPLETNSEDPRINEYRQLVQAFMKNKDEQTLRMSPDLNSHERMLIHSLVEREFTSLHHESVGEGKDRCICLTKKQKKTDEGGAKTKSQPLSDVRPSAKIHMKGGASNMFDGLLEDESEVMKSSNEKEDSQKKKEHNTNKRCHKCLKSVPLDNFSLHELRCRPPGGSVKKANIPDSDDFDEICEAFANLDRICNASGCKKKVGTLGMNCAYCLKRFCLKHGMAEIHGCGEEARRVARKQIAREGKIYPGSGKPDRSMDKMKRIQLAKRLDKKINEKVDDRKVKKKDKQ